MKYIDKSVNREAGGQIIDELLNDAWSDGEGEYLGADYYNGLSDKKYKERLIKVIRSEQSGLCCYCLQIITEKNMTLEHIIPNNIDVSCTDLPLYFEVPELYAHVIYKEDFVRTIKQIPPEKYPHDIAYANLIGSCDSNTHCNHYRGDEFIKPFMYDINIGNKVSYDRAGRIDCEEYFDDFHELGLFNNKLKRIRKVWKLLAEKIEDIESITNKEFKVELISLQDDYEPKNEFVNILTDLSFEKLLPYKWFYHYYKQAGNDNE